MASAITPMGTAILADSPAKYHSLQDDQQREVPYGFQIPDGSGNGRVATVRYDDLDGAAQGRSKVYSNDPLLPPLPIASGRNWSSGGEYTSDAAQPYIDLGSAGFESAATAGITVEMWSYIDHPGWGERLLTIKGATDSWRLAVAQDGASVSVESASGADLPVAVEIADKKWHHIGLSVTAAGAATLVVDGVSYSAGTLPTAIGQVQRITLWKNIENPTKDFGGGLAHIAMWASAKPASMIQAHYAAGKVNTGLVPQRGTYHHAKTRADMLAPYPDAAPIADNSKILMLEHWSLAGSVADMQAYKAIGSDGTILANADAAKTQGITNAQWAANAATAGYPYMIQPGTGKQLTQPEVSQGGKPAAYALTEERAGHYDDILDPELALVPAGKAVFLNCSWDLWDLGDRDLYKRTGDFARPLASLDGYTHAANSDVRAKLARYLGLMAEQVHTSRATRLVMERTAALYSYSGPKLLHQFVSTGHTYETMQAGIITPEEMRGDCWATILAGGTPLWFNKSFAHREVENGPMVYPTWNASTQYDRISTVLYNGKPATPYISKPAVGVAPSLASGWVVGWDEDGACLDDKGKYPGATAMMRTTRDELQAVALLHNAGGYLRYKPHADLVARYWPNAKLIDTSKPGATMLVMQDVPEAGTYTLQLPAEMATATSITDQTGKTYPITAGKITATFAAEYEHLLLQATGGGSTTTTPTTEEPTVPTVPVSDAPIFPSVDAAGAFESPLVRNEIRSIVAAMIGGAATGVPTTPGKVIYIGDSLSSDNDNMGGDAKAFITSRFLAQGFTSVWHYGYYGKTINTSHLTGGVNDPATVTQIQQALTEVTDPQVMAIALGTNSTTPWDAYQAWLADPSKSMPDIVAATQVLDAIPAGVLPVWVGIYYPVQQESQVPALNAELKKLVESRGGVFLDWQAQVQTLGLDTSPAGTAFRDGTHMTPAGYAAKYDWVSKATADAVRGSSTGGVATTPAEVTYTPPAI